MEFTPVQVTIGLLVDADKHLQKHFGEAKYLLQIWNKQGVKVLEYKLKQQVKLWAICFNNLVFKTESPDEDSDCI